MSNRCSNSQDQRNPSIWFVDHNYHENMYEMFRKVCNDVYERLRCDIKEMLQVTAKEKVVGWYSTGPKIKASDIDIHEVSSSLKYIPPMGLMGLLCRCGANIVPESQSWWLLMFNRKSLAFRKKLEGDLYVDCVCTHLESSTKAYVTMDEVVDEGKKAARTFKHIPSEIGALEAEEVGVEHLLRRERLCGAVCHDRLTAVSEM